MTYKHRLYVADKTHSHGLRLQPKEEQEKMNTLPRSEPPVQHKTNRIETKVRWLSSLPTNASMGRGLGKNNKPSREKQTTVAHAPAEER